MEQRQWQDYVSANGGEEVHLAARTKRIGWRGFLLLISALRLRSQRAPAEVIVTRTGNKNDC